MRSKWFFLGLVLMLACGAGPFRGQQTSGAGFLRPVGSGPQLFSGVNGPGPGVIPYGGGPNGGMGGRTTGSPDGSISGSSAQILFQGLDGMIVHWDVGAVGMFDSEERVTPFAQNFNNGHIYRLRISNIPNRADKVYYPTLKINSVTPRSESYLSHNAIPVKFTDNDIDQVDAGNFVTKVIFLPAPEFQNLAVAGGVDTIVNTQLPAGADPVVEAQNRGAILAVIQIGNKDLGLSPSYGYAGSEGMYGGSGQPNGMGGGRVPQIPISGVNVPAFGSPSSVTPFGIPGPPVLPAAPEGVRTRLFSPVNPMPSTEIPGNQNSWNGIQF